MECIHERKPQSKHEEVWKTGTAAWAIVKTADARINEMGCLYLCLSALNITPLKTTSSQIGTSTITEANSTMAPDMDAPIAVVSTADSAGLRLNIAANNTWVSSAPSKMSGACHSTWSSRQDSDLNPRADHEILDLLTHHSIKETVAIDIAPIVHAKPSSAPALSIKPERKCEAHERTKCYCRNNDRYKT